MNKTIFKTGLILAFAIFLNSCQSKDDYSGNIAMVDGKAITEEQFSKELDFYQKFYSKKYGEDYLEKEISRSKTNNDQLQKDLIDSMVKDQVMVNDLANNKVKVDDSFSTKLKNDLENKLGGKDSLKANITALGISENQFDQNIYNDSIRKQHYQYFITNSGIKDSEVLNYYQENENLHRQYKYNILIFDKEDDAQKAFDQMKDAKDFTDYLEKTVKNYDILKSDFVYIDDPYLEASKVTEKDKISPVFEYDGKYMILMINSYNDNENELLMSAKDLYQKQKYEQYLNKLVKKSKIRLFVK